MKRLRGGASVLSSIDGYGKGFETRLDNLAPELADTSHAHRVPDARYHGQPPHHHSHGPTRAYLRQSQRNQTKRIEAFLRDHSETILQF
jgi:hypothetical protein